MTDEQTWLGRYQAVKTKWLLWATEPENTACGSHVLNLITDLKKAGVGDGLQKADWRDEDLRKQRSAPLEPGAMKTRNGEA